MTQIAARGVRATFEAECGHLPELVIDGVSVLWSAPWRDDPVVQADASLPLVDRRLGGSFLCVPFGRDDVDGGPPHGMSANGPWQILRHSPSALTARATLARGRVQTRFALRDGHPGLYRMDVLDLTMPCTFALHPMLDVTGGARLSGPLRATLTFDAECPAFPQNARAEGWGDMPVYPAQTCEDFATLIHTPGLTATAVARAGQDDTILFVKQAAQLPVTNLWMSNGAREASPWAGTQAVLGVEDGICAGAEGFAAALAGRGRIADEGVATCLPAGRHVIPTAILRLPGLHEVTQVAAQRDLLTITTPEGTQSLPFDTGHFA